jgi:uncharacterized protein
VIAFMLALAVTLPDVAATQTSLPTVVVHAPKTDLTLEVARTDAQREHGLMDRTSIPPQHGMIFVFDGDGTESFWMKDTLVPLDMIFVGSDGTVRKVFASVPVVAPALPDAKIPLETAPAKYVIELAAGEAAQDGIVEGTKLGIQNVPAALGN